MEMITECLNCGIITMREILEDELGKHIHCKYCQSSCDV